ncbi:hypothetical protein GCM10007941_33630 [Amphritea balenae]|nr:hypothetical protein GCM10007941_33630 [Amphritea balenae]
MQCDDLCFNSYMANELRSDMTELRFDGHERRAYRLVLNHCPPELDSQKELEFTKLIVTALLLGIDEEWVASQLERGCVDVIAARVRQSIH